MSSLKLIDSLEQGRALIATKSFKPGNTPSTGHGSGISMI
jgi:hypothetical protein